MDEDNSLVITSHATYFSKSIWCQNILQTVERKEIKKKKIEGPVATYLAPGPRWPSPLPPAPRPSPPPCHSRRGRPLAVPSPFATATGAVGEGISSPPCISPGRHRPYFSLPPLTHALALSFSARARRRSPPSIHGRRRPLDLSR